MLFTFSELHDYCLVYLQFIYWYFLSIWIQTTNTRNLQRYVYTNCFLFSFYLNGLISSRNDNSLSRGKGKLGTKLSVRRKKLKHGIYITLVAQNNLQGIRQQFICLQVIYRCTVISVKSSSAWPNLLRRRAGHRIRWRRTALIWKDEGSYWTLTNKRQDNAFFEVFCITQYSSSSKVLYTLVLVF